jgi:hypothetical protein
MDVTEKILSIRQRIIDILLIPANAIANWILSFGSVFDNINETLSGIPEKIIGYFNSLTDWINTKAIEFFTSIVEPIILIFLDMVIKLFTEGILALVSLPGSVVKSAVSGAFGGFKDVINTATLGGFNAAVNATVSIVNSPFNVIKEAVKGIPDLV